MTVRIGGRLVDHVETRAVRAIRSLDQRGGLFTRRGFRAYAASARLVQGLHRIVVDEVVASVGGASLTIVDIGSGPGDLVRELARRLPAARVVGIEPSPEMREIARERGAESLAGAAEDLPLPDGSVDMVLSTLSSHHWPDVAAALREIDRVIRPDGEAVIYDARFVAYGGCDLLALADAAGIDRCRIAYGVVATRGIRLYSYVRLRGRHRGSAA